MGQPIVIRQIENMLIEVGGAWFDPCDVVFISANNKTCVMQLRGATRLIEPLATAQEVAAAISQERVRREQMIRARLPKRQTPEEAQEEQRRQIEAQANVLSQALKEARRAADPDADQPWKQD